MRMKMMTETYEKIQSNCAADGLKVKYICLVNLLELPRSAQKGLNKMQS